MFYMLSIYPTSYSSTITMLFRKKKRKKEKKKRNSSGNSTTSEHVQWIRIDAVFLQSTRQ
jgi:hypothetical protein